MNPPETLIRVVAVHNKNKELVATGAVFTDGVIILHYTDGHTAIYPDEAAGNQSLKAGETVSCMTVEI